MFLILECLFLHIVTYDTKFVVDNDSKKKTIIVDIKSIICLSSTIVVQKRTFVVDSKLTICLFVRRYQESGGGPRHNFLSLKSCSSFVTLFLEITINSSQMRMCFVQANKIDGFLPSYSLLLRIFIIRQ